MPAGLIKKNLNPVNAMISKSRLASYAELAAYVIVGTSFYFRSYLRIASAAGHHMRLIQGSTLFSLILHQNSTDHVRTCVSFRQWSDACLAVYARLGDYTDDLL